jgi:alpha-beta hydrolase superfamily lysophospholipase
LSTGDDLRRVESHFDGAADRTLFRRAWLPSEPKRSVVLVHGYAEHSGRYEYVGATLAADGAAVHALDQQGHGRSSGRRGHVRRFGDFLDDLEVLVSLVLGEHPGLPLYVVGHSMGGLIVASYACERNPNVAGVATSGAALALSDALSGGRIFAARLLGRVLPRLSIASNLDSNGLSRDPEVVRAYLEDPLVFGTMTTSLGSEMMSAIERNAGEGGRVRVPMLLLHGEDDPLCPVSGSQRFFDQLDVPKRRFHSYPGLRHEIFNEPERDQVLSDLTAWIRDVEGGSAG